MSGVPEEDRGRCPDCGRRDCAWWTKAVPADPRLAAMYADAPEYRPLNEAQAKDCDEAAKVAGFPLKPPPLRPVDQFGRVIDDAPGGQSNSASVENSRKAEAVLISWGFSSCRGKDK